ncbi:MAG: flagellar motor protein MotA [Roseobacter sp. MedPE-SWde]|uniref:MotA/TolQ/ExbB proton channel family protein n=1 Tax=Roseobacter sp. MED193 TaxID=314262 RepID=UPI000068BBBA|nr:MotA/TolQ/ExbB proton channel family protein [Roseobacter sp. MED193]EAQ44838.1 MotA/TolQ/ExbB proton channel family protein [Roseobacter sp. MED193]OIQ43585.1 MAG: flagellar motor protein MotA [Roseobacter sp. MedPE-SWde]
MTPYISLSAALLLATATYGAAQETAQTPAPSAPVLAAPTVDSTGSGLATPPISPTDLTAARPTLSSPVEGTAAEATAPMAAPATPAAEATASNNPTTTVPASPSPVSPEASDPAAAHAELGDETTPSSAVELPALEPLSRQDEMLQLAEETSGKAMKFLRDGGPSIWAIAALSVITLALILWKIWRLALIGAWSRGKASKAVLAYEAGNPAAALAIVKGRMGIRSKVVSAGLDALRDLPEDRAREETARIAKKHLAQAGTGLGALELIATIAPLLGLLGTVLGMIAAFQALQQAGSKADPALLAGGIWEALLTTAAGMAVAIPASAALTWFESVITRIRQDIEDSATRLFVAEAPQDLPMAAE